LIAQRQADRKIQARRIWKRFDGSQASRLHRQMTGQ
jgi:hypothetical protein